MHTLEELQNMIHASVNEWVVGKRTAIIIKNKYTNVKEFKYFFQALAFVPNKGSVRAICAENEDESRVDSTIFFEVGRAVGQAGVYPNMIDVSAKGVNPYKLKTTFPHIEAVSRLTLV